MEPQEQSGLAALKQRRSSEREGGLFRNLPPEKRVEAHHKLNELVSKHQAGLKLHPSRYGLLVGCVTSLMKHEGSFAARMNAHKKWRHWRRNTWVEEQIAQSTPQRHVPIDLPHRVLWEEF